MMAAGAVLVLLGLVYVDLAVAAVDQQAADLDPNQSRLERAFAVGAWGLGTLVAGLVVFVLGLLPYVVSAIRVGRHHLHPTPVPRTIAAVSAIAIALCLLYGFYAPSGPLMQAAALASGGGGPAGSVQIVTFDGDLMAVSAAGQTSAEDLHPFTPAASYGAVKLKFGWGASASSATGRLVAILEASDGQGGWEELGSTDTDSQTAELDIPPRSYAGDLRVRVVVAGPGATQGEYAGAVSFDPTP